MAVCHSLEAAGRGQLSLIANNVEKNESVSDENEALRLNDGIVDKDEAAQDVKV